QPAPPRARFLPARAGARSGPRPRQLQPRTGAGARGQSGPARRIAGPNADPRSMPEQRKKLRLRELLVQQGLITTDQLSIVLAERAHTTIPIGRLLVRPGFVTQSAIRDITARRIGQESVDPGQVVAAPATRKLVGQEGARRNRV